MPFSFSFTLPPRSTLPSDFDPVNRGLGRHHILGRKYIQLLFALSAAVEVEDKYRKRFANWPTMNSSRVPPQDSSLESRFFWSPFNLFVGPDSTWRAWDPGSGIEKVRPPGLDTIRWDTLNAIPTYLESIGLKKDALAGLADNTSMQLILTPDKSTLKSKLTELIKSVNDTSKADKVLPYSFVENEWVAVRDDVALGRFLERTTDVAQGFKFATDNKYLYTGKEDARFDNVVTNNLRGIKFLLKPL